MRIIPKRTRWGWLIFNNVTVYLKATSGSVDIVYADHSLE